MVVGLRVARMELMTDRATELRLETGGEQWWRCVTRTHLYPGAPCYLAAVSVKCPLVIVFVLYTL